MYSIWYLPRITMSKYLSFWSTAISRSTCLGSPALSIWVRCSELVTLCKPQRRKWAGKDVGDDTQLALDRLPARRGRSVCWNDAQSAMCRKRDPLLMTSTRHATPPYQ